MADPMFRQIKTFSLTVPSDYVHDTRLDSFVKAHGGEFVYLGWGITDHEFRKVTFKLAPGQKFRVKIFQVNSKIIHTKEKIFMTRTQTKTKIRRITSWVETVDCLEFLHLQNAVLVGAQGASLVYELFKSELPEGVSIRSYDELDALPVNPLNGPEVPVLSRESFGDFNFYRGLTCPGSSSALLCFCKCN